MGERKNAYRNLMGNLEGTRNWEDQNIGGWMTLR
jgi:hypothetical protein